MTGRKWTALLMSGCILLLIGGGALASLAETQKGDLNGDGVIDSADARILWRHLDSGYVLTSTQQACADMNENGILNPIDAKLLWQAACAADDVGGTSSESTESTTIFTAPPQYGDEEDPFASTHEDEYTFATTTTTTAAPTTTTTTTTTAAPTTTTTTTTTTAATTTTASSSSSSGTVASSSSTATTVATTTTTTATTTTATQPPVTGPTAQTPPLPAAVTTPPAQLTLQTSPVPESTYMSRFKIAAQYTAGGTTQVFDCSTKEGLQMGLTAVVKCEMGASWFAVSSTEAWKAQAVVSYTHIAQWSFNYPNGTFTVQVQSTVDPVNNANDKRIYEAVGEVLGTKVMIPSAGSDYSKLCYGFYSASVAGSTASCHKVYTANLPYAQSVFSPETDELLQKYPGSGSFTRSYPYTMDEIVDELEYYLGTDVSYDTREDAFSFYATEWDGAYMAKSNLYYMKSGVKTYVTGMQLRSALGLATHALLVTAEEDGVMTVQMRGRGHAVGFSQIGAVIFANEYGWTYDQIITHYFSITKDSVYQICLPNW